MVLVTKVDLVTVVKVEEEEVDRVVVEMEVQGV